MAKRQGEEKATPKGEAKASAAKKAKVQEGADTKAVPAVVLASPPPAVAASAPPACRPELPSPESPEAAIPVVTKIMQWAVPLVLEEMKKRKLLGDHDGTKLEDVRPLEFDKASSSSSPSTYKETWQPQNAEASLRTRGLYEAGGSLFWVSPLASKDCDSEVTWAAVVKGCALLKPKCFEGSKRILWPFTLQTVTSDILAADQYPKALEMVHGHVMLYSWWVEMYHALHTSDYERVSMALCTTVNLQLLPRRRSGLIAKYIWAASDTWEMADILAIPFHVFAFKIAFLIEELPASTRSSQKKILEALQKEYKDVPLKYQGKVLNKTMLSAAVAIANAFPDGQSGARFLTLIFQWWGPVLSNYGRLYKVATTVAGYVKDQDNSDQLQQAGFRWLCWPAAIKLITCNFNSKYGFTRMQAYVSDLMAFMLHDLKYEEVYTHELTSDDFFFGDSDGSGWLPIAFLRIATFSFLRNIAEKGGASDDCKDAIRQLAPGLS